MRLSTGTYRHSGGLHASLIIHQRIKDPVRFCISLDTEPATSIQVYLMEYKGAYYASTRTYAGGSSVTTSYLNKAKRDFSDSLDGIYSLALESINKETDE